MIESCENQNGTWADILIVLFFEKAIIFARIYMTHDLFAQSSHNVETEVFGHQ